MDVLQTLLTWVVVVFIASTMLGVGLSTTPRGLGNVFTKSWFVLGALVANLVVIPLLAWGVAELFDLPIAAYVALVLIGASAGGPFSVALNKNQKGYVVTGAAMMTVLALIGSVATPLIVNWIFDLSDVLPGSIGSINVGELVRAIVILQVIPLAIGMTMRSLTPSAAESWLGPTNRVAAFSFGGVLIGMVFGGFSSVMALFGSRALLAALLAGLLFFAAGWLLSPAPERLRSTAGFTASVRNAAPVFVIALGALEAIEGLIAAIIAMYLVMLVVYVFLAALFGRRNAQEPEDLKIVEGIGPEVEAALVAGGITTLYELGGASRDDLVVILEEGDISVNINDPATWPKQASLAALGEDEELAALQARLAAGRDVGSSS
jgi:bile acid:Na+ symporter, BASS family